jgi:hypothetical protein
MQGAMTLLVLSPVAAAIGLTAYFLLKRSRAGDEKPELWPFFSTVAFWAVGAVVAAGILEQAVVSPLIGRDLPFALFLYGPPALAVGAILGAVIWRKSLKRNAPR